MSGFPIDPVVATTVAILLAIVKEWVRPFLAQDATTQDWEIRGLGVLIAWACLMAGYADGHSLSYHVGLLLLRQAALTYFGAALGYHALTDFVPALAKGQPSSSPTSGVS